MNFARTIIKGKFNNKPSFTTRFDSLWISINLCSEIRSGKYVCDFIKTNKTVNLKWMSTFQISSWTWKLGLYLHILASKYSNEFWNDSFYHRDYKYKFFKLSQKMSFYAYRVFRVLVFILSNSLGFYEIVAVRLGFAQVD